MQFSKMHGLGNDFMVIDAVTQNVNLQPNTIKKLADRHYGIGFDQLLLVEAPYSPDTDFYYRIFNCDGTEVEQCGNGARCFAKFVQLKKLTSKKKIKVGTKKGTITLFINNDSITVDMGKPNFEPAVIPMKANKFEKNYILRTNTSTVLCGAVSMGNPHCVVNVDDINTKLVAELGPQLEKHERFPEHVNVGFMQVVNRNHIKLRVHERGVGETKACGSGACAAVAVGVIQGLLDSKVEVDLIGGRLLIELSGQEQSLLMTGPATHVYDGIINL